MKWWWRYGQETPNLWKEVVNAKYGKLDNWCTKKNTAPHGVGPWKYINNMKDDFFQEVSFRIGNGTSVKFWKDKWLLNIPLKDSHPRLFLIATEPDSTVASNRDGNIWDIRFRRNLQDWELGEIFDLFKSLERFPVNSQTPDSLKWGESSKGVFSVKASYNRMNTIDVLTDPWPWKLIWKTKLPTKIKCFTWTALKNATLTLDNFKKKKIHLVNRCYMCQKESESVNHLFLHCPVAADLWHMFTAILGISWTIPYCLKGAVESWSLWKMNETINKIWQMIPACIFWCLWIERNSRCFDGTSTPNCSLKSKCLVNLFSWSNLSPVNDVIPLLDFIGSLSVA
ncbi:putative ribonuclease H protein At1g65750 isoform X3 [Lycium barbarum]|uniref:putative ribonuclease H protein At1g65750 isoform X3 n=1 Tax=Lycium barbarum TaxID=112863 RepID=UPI00293E3A1D|nr:putative ribonuclease H protein At1g65750 isoform X3 [Lycium barbarum]